MPDLFSEIVRSRKEPHKRGERLYDFYNQCARMGYEEFRTFLNGWVSEFSEADQIELIARMRSGGDRAFHCGFIEIVVHAFLQRLNYKVVAHPVVYGTTKRPDFGILDENERIIAYVEVTTVNPPNSDEASTNRESLIYNAIDKVRLPTGYVLAYSVHRRGISSPSLAPLIREVELWAREAVSTQRPDEKITRRFVSGDWEIELDLLSGNPTKNYEHSIGIASGAADWIAPHLDLRGALELKSKKYGDFNAPYLIVVADAKGQLFGVKNTKDALTEAVLGDEIVQWRDGEPPKFARAYNGFWRKRAAPRNTHVSAVLFFPDVGLWGLRSNALQPIFAVNPWAQFPLPDSIKVLGRFESQNDTWSFIEGRNFADILGLPTPWPPEDSK